jgi:hypothetical protein
MTDIHELYNDVTSGGEATFILSYRGSEFEFEVRALRRTRKNDVLAALPEGFLDPTAIPDSLDRDELAELSDEELIKEIEDAGGDVGELMSGQLLDAEATEVVIDAMVDSFSHPELADTELRNMLESSQFPDSGFNQMLNKMIEVSTPSEGVRDFRGSS